MASKIWEIFCEESTYTNSDQMKRKLIRIFNFKNKCSCCGLSKWMGNFIPIKIDHINGINNDNRVENLRFLCYNCYSQKSP